MNNITSTSTSTTTSSTTSSLQTQPDRDGNIYRVGDSATHVLWTDCKAGYIVEVSASGRTVTFQSAEQELLNGCNSGEPDALQCASGGFCGHVSGKQRWRVADNPTGYRQKFTLRKNGYWKVVGTNTYESGNSLIKNHHPYYDFNF